MCAADEVSALGMDWTAVPATLEGVAEGDVALTNPRIGVENYTLRLR